MNTKLAALTAASVLALGVGTAAAADIYSGAQTQDNYQPQRMNWTGLYVGGAIGYGNANHDLSVRDYFKDFCSDNAGEESFDPFDAYDRNRTFENRVREANESSDGTDIYDVPNPAYNPAQDSNGDGIANGPGDSTTGTDVYRFLKGPVNTAVWTDCASVQRTYGANNDAGAQSSPLVGAGASSGALETISGDSREVASLDGVNSTGVVGDLRIGYDQQMGRFVLGVFGTYGFSGMEADGASVAGPFTDISLERGDDWSIGARAGMLVNDRTLLYILAAYTETEYDFSGTFNGEAFSQDTTFSGITVGGGVEFAVSQNIFLGVEGTHTFYDGEAIFDHYDPATNVGTVVHDDLGETKIMGTLKIKLNEIFNN